MAPADDNLAAGLAAMAAELSALREELARKDRCIVYQAEQIDKLKAALDDSRRSGKRQAAPFSKADPKPDPDDAGPQAGRSPRPSRASDGAGCPAGS